jgi:hypothetical protein
MRNIMKAMILSTLFAAAAGAASISGTVKSGGGGPGGGAALAGAKVVLVSFTGSSGNNGVRVDSGVTNAQGKYAFDSVKTGFYQVQASLSGYQNGSNFGNVNRANQALTIDVTLQRTATAASGTVLGIVHDASTLAAIANATVVLGHRSGGGGGTVTFLDTVKTGSDGRFVFDSVPAAGNYLITAMASGYVTQSNNNLDVSSGDTTRVTLNMAKQPTPSAKIVGRVLEDSNKAVTGARVVLRRRAGAGFPVVWENLDSLVTGSDGAFVFDSLAASAQGSPYDLVVSKTDYETSTSQNIPLAQNQTDTVNVRLTKVSKGSMYIFVGQDTAAHPPLEGASVTAVLQGQEGVEYSATTDNKGWATFPSVIAGSYVVTAGLNGYLTKNAQRTVQPDEKDTGLVYLARATASNSKSLAGLVRNGAGKGIEGADVVFESNGGALNHITVHGTTTATGDYSFEGIPMGVNGGTITVQADGYSQFTGNVTLGAASNFLNVTLQAAVSVRFNRAASGLPRLVLSGGISTLEFPAAARAGRLLVYDGKGILLRAFPVAAGASKLTLPQEIGLGRAFRYAVWEQPGSSLSLPLSPRP